MSQQKSQRLTGTIVRVFKSTPEWSSGRILETESGKTFGFTVKAPIEQDDEVTLVGAFKIHPRFGEQFEAKWTEREIPATWDGVAEHLARTPKFKGLGRSRAEDLVNAARELNDDPKAFGETIIEHSAKLRGMAGLPSNVALGAIGEQWIADSQMNEVCSALAAASITEAKARQLFEKFGSRSLEIIKSNPYSLIGVIHGFGFKVVDKIALSNGVAPDSTYRIHAAIEHAEEELRQNGYTMSRRRSLIARAVGLLEDSIEDARALIISELGMMLAPGGSNLIPVTVEEEGDHVARERVHECEEFIAQTLKRYGHSMSPALNVPASDLEEALAGLQPAQTEAVHGSLSSQISVMTGGAGCGKTFTIARILDLFQSAGYRIALAAPTGKAAKRMMEQTGRMASTIHRLLEPQFADGGLSFARDGSNPLEASLVIVDEASMIDVALFASLLDAIRFHEGARLLIVGDHNQLPSVGAGAVLRDIIAGSMVPVTKLETVMRQAGVLRANTAAVLRGKLLETTEEDAEKNAVEIDEGRLDPRPWIVQLTDDPSKAAGIELALKQAKSFYSKAVDGRGESIFDVQMLAPKRNVARLINYEIQALRASASGEAVAEPRWSKDGREVFPPRPVNGDKIICTRNDYDRGVMNGTLGEVIYVASIDGPRTFDTEKGPVKLRLKKGDFVIRFEEGRDPETGEVLFSSPTAYGSTAMHDIEVAYAITVHKSQGSEWRFVFLAMADVPWDRFDRALLYTGVSRASRKIVIGGNKRSVSNCIRNRNADERLTALPLLFQRAIGITAV